MISMQADVWLVCNLHDNCQKPICIYMQQPMTNVTR